MPRRSGRHKKGSRTREAGYEGPTGWKKVKWVRRKLDAVGPIPGLRRLRGKTSFPAVRAEPQEPTYESPVVEIL